MYYIYHIPGKKVGCTKNLNNRLRQQNATTYEILETHSDIDIASNRERELQKQYGYKVDKILYKDAVQRRPKWTKSQSDKGRETMIKNGFFNEWYKKGNATRIKSVAKCNKITGEIIETYKSVADAARSVNKEGNTSTISACCKNKKNSYMGYKWIYLLNNKSKL
jgi:hypothetical protein